MEKRSFSVVVVPNPRQIVSIEGVRIADASRNRTRLSGMITLRSGMLSLVASY